MNASRPLAALGCAFVLSCAWPALGADGPPNFDIKRTCAMDESAQNGIPDPNCLRQEEQAKQQLQSIWRQTKPDTRQTCLGADADSPIRSYVDVLTCVQMFKDAQ